MSRDPAGSGRNWYSYCDNDPLLFVDPDGQQLGPLQNRALPAIGRGLKELAKKLWPAAKKAVAKKGSGPKIKPDSQGKHIPGHRNFKPGIGKSEFTHDSPQRLLDKFAGTGRKHFDKTTGKLRKEVVDFRENIGTYVDPKTGQNAPLISKETWKVIHENAAELDEAVLYDRSKVLNPK